jgi:hypothetical protein
MRLAAPAACFWLVKLTFILPLSAQLVQGRFDGSVLGVGDAMTQAPQVGQARATTAFGPYGMDSDRLHDCQPGS